MIDIATFLAKIMIAGPEAALIVAIAFYFTGADNEKRRD